MCEVASADIQTHARSDHGRQDRYRRSDSAIPSAVLKHGVLSSRAKVKVILIHRIIEFTMTI